MDNESFFETYLYLSPKKFIISVIQIKDLKLIHKIELFIENDSNIINFEKLTDFLDDNILKLEKVLNHFIKDISVILKSEDFIPIYLSVKNNNNGNFLTLDNLSFSLNDARNQCKKTFEEKKIIHTLIENYQINNKNYSTLPNKLKCNDFSLDIKFISLSEKFIKILEKSLKKYQISLNKIISANYVKSFFKDDHDIITKVRQITLGCNPNEVKFYNKNIKNKGFFVKFFNFFR